MQRLLSSMTPAEAWLPWENSPAHPFDRRAAAHLYRRAAFAASSRELDEAVRIGPVASVQQLWGGKQDTQAFDDEMRRLAQVPLAAGDAKMLSAWWLHRIRHSPAPLLEKMTLFWHGHFATSGAKVRDVRLMYEQNALLRRHALGDFSELVRSIARDGAMLLYLDSDTNRKNHPNENFAREVMELFCLGTGHYSERDIQELARCFTGWEIQYGAFKFNPNQHDGGRKTVLGKTGTFGGDDALAIVLQHPASAEFLCRKLVRYFVTDDEDFPAEYVEPLARQFRESGLDVGRLVKTILTSRLFYASSSVASKIRSPVELGVGLLTALEAAANMRQLAIRLEQLGQLPLFPPNVKGWSGGRAWIDSSTLLGRINLVGEIADSPTTRFAGTTLEGYCERLNLHNSTKIVDFLDELLLAAPLSEDVRQQLLAQGERESKAGPLALQRLLHLFAALPELQLA